MSRATPPPLLEARGLGRRYPAPGGGSLTALDRVHLALWPGEVVGLLGESGCGKSTLARCLLALERPDTGELWLEGQLLDHRHRGQVRRLRRAVQIVLQDPSAALDPRFTVERSLAEPLRALLGLTDRAELRRRTEELLGRVGLAPELAGRVPHQLSGGERQRVCLARALAPEPRLLVADEPLSALDAPRAAELAGLLGALQRQEGMGLLLISHDLPRVRELADRLVVMYLGRVVEQGPAAVVGRTPAHPYSQALLDAVLSLPGPADAPVPGLPDPLPGEVPDPARQPAGCPFHPRCPLHAQRQNPRCPTEEPELQELAPGHQVACHEATPTNAR